MHTNRMMGEDERVGGALSQGRRWRILVLALANPGAEVCQSRCWRLRILVLKFASLGAGACESWC